MQAMAGVCDDEALRSHRAGTTMAQRRQTLAERRRALGLTQEELAELLGVDRSTIVRWEAGVRQPRPHVRPQLAGALRLSLSELNRLLTETTPVDQVEESLLDKGIGPSYSVEGVVPGHDVLIDPAGGDALWFAATTVELVSSFTRTDLALERREATRMIIGMVFGSALLEPLERWLSVSHTGTHRDRRSPVGQDALEPLERAAQQFRGWDDQFGGGLRRKAVIGQLSEVAELLRDQRDTEIKRRLLAVMAQLAETAATMSWDSGMGDVAQRYYLLALQASTAAGDPAFGANVLAGMARQLLYLNRPSDALELTRLAQEGCAGHATATVRSMLHTREAWAYAKQGRIGAFRRATSKAEDALDDADPFNDPYWISYFDQAELAGVTGGRLLELVADHPQLAEEAAEHIARAVELREPRHLRSAALDQIGLAETRFRQDEFEEGCRLGHQALDVAERTHSDRVRQQLLDLHECTQSRRRSPAVAELHDRMRPLLAESAAGWRRPPQRGQEG